MKLQSHYPSVKSPCANTFISTKKHPDKQWKSLTPSGELCGLPATDWFDYCRSDQQALVLLSLASSYV